ncbi:16S rRNA (cytidine1402-2'-O)-methyltransferase [Thermodesulfitimonas autotrophica]|uniref:Ribosomal RNA small subunit methyltransferase I n=1 Tax=Thermodesulfitimonas autotrophica TaxID=1894989 RepID=A0A3N5AQI4_9THEO|nr:16S rRNA (cytidine(1402)-2'-O)-methyltransferase [Thermodesulfitimonas autotrophica]RPF47143.1 16S rRNA (cytidine1402-2'-O)-methyltransferase [Thermodesulfitimonas autotrophica]
MRMKGEPNKGKLYVCPTPIGNLEDITLRVLAVLARVNLIAAEDTRHTRKLLTHYGIKTPLLSYHSHNQKARGEELLARLARGEHIALVSDAGTPGISDPGALLVREAVARGIPVEALPGPSAVLTALVVSGLDSSRFVFEGFLPARRRRRALEELAGERRTIIFFEAPHRLLATLEDILAIIGDRPVAVARELTKVHEEVFRGKVSEALAYFRERPPQGEVTVVLAGREAPPEGAARKTENASLEEKVPELVRQLTAAGMQKRAAIKEAARRFGVPAREVYALEIKAKKNAT